MVEKKTNDRRGNNLRNRDNPVINKLKRILFLFVDSFNYEF